MNTDKTWQARSLQWWGCNLALEITRVLGYVAGWLRGTLATWQNPEGFENANTKHLILGRITWRKVSNEFRDQSEHEIYRDGNICNHEFSIL